MVIQPQDYNYTKRCPKCGSTEIRYGFQKNYAALYADLFMASKIIWFVCGDCGYVTDQFVHKPKRMNKINNEL